MFPFQGETQDDSEMMTNCTELMTKLESSFSALVNAIIGKFGQQLSGILQESLECSICKELIIEVDIKFFALINTSFNRIVVIHDLFSFDRHFPGPVHTHSATTAWTIG